MKTKETVNKGLCSTCVNEKDCGYTRKFPVHACDDFTLGKSKNFIKNETWNLRD